MVNHDMKDNHKPTIMYTNLLCTSNWTQIPAYRYGYFLYCDNIWVKDLYQWYWFQGGYVQEVLISLLWIVAKRE